MDCPLPDRAHDRAIRSSTRSSMRAASRMPAAGVAAPKSILQNPGGDSSFSGCLDLDLERGLLNPLRVPSAEYGSGSCANITCRGVERPLDGALRITESRGEPPGSFRDGREGGVSRVECVPFVNKRETVAVAVEVPASGFATGDRGMRNEGTFLITGGALWGLSSLRGEATSRILRKDSRVRVTFGPELSEDDTSSGSDSSIGGVMGRVCGSTGTCSNVLALSLLLRALGV